MEDNMFTSTTLEEMQKQVQDLLVAFAAKLETRFDDIEKSIEKIEQQIATLILGFGEQAVNMEGLLAQLRFASPESQKIFMDTIADSRKKMLEVMKEGAGDLLAGESPGLASALENLAAEKLSDGTD